MKTTSFLKLTMAITVLLLGIAIVSCENETTTTETTKESTNQEIKAPSDLIPLEKAIKEYNNFYNTRVALIKRELGEQEKRSVWFSKESLETYLDKIEKVSKEKGIDLSGINFVFATDKNNKQTLFLSPTIYQNDRNYHKSFSINNGEILYIDQIKDQIEVNNNIQSDNTSESLILLETGIIDNKTTLEMFNKYFETSVKPLINEMDFDTRAVWHSVEEMRNYIAYVETKTKADVSGFNIVFSVYDNTPDLSIKANKKTLFFLPTTYETTSKQNKAFSLVGGNLAFLELGKKLLDKNLIIKSSTSTSLIMNGGGQQSPPPYTIE